MGKVNRKQFVLTSAISLSMVKKGMMALAVAAAVVFSVSVVANDYGFGDRSLFSDRAIAERLKPAAAVCVEGEDCGSAAAEAGGAGMEVAMAADEVYSTNCLACHATGAAGAPKTGDVAEWQARIDDKGVDMLVTNAINGIGMMPAKGTCGSCSDDTIREVVEYILAESK